MQRKQFYNWLVQRMGELDAAPRKLAFRTPTHPGKYYKSFTRTRSSLESQNFEHVEHFTVHRGPAESTLEPVEFDITGSVGQQLDFDWSARMQITPSTLRISKHEALLHMIDFAALTIQRYGFIFFMAREDGPTFVAFGVTYGDRHGRTEMEIENLGYWGVYGNLHRMYPLLRDVYPLSFLSRPYLDLPVYGTTLERWIRKDVSRGTLEPLKGNEAISVWRPVPANIPAIREQLFPTGALFFFRYFQDWEPDNPWKRDFSKPYRMPKEPIPEIFRADFYKGRDPAVTR
ncbi:MAG TPA: hypothetical protein PLD59_16895 [Tepidisphaeraceae bacterium]|nr:hypothetical protein [Tepidisphaeraceae bacterium]